MAVTAPGESPEVRLRVHAYQLRHTPTLPAEPGRVDGIAGQERAREALRFGLAVAGEGYNIAVAGAPSSGRNTLVLEMVNQVARDLPPPQDWLYLHNFSDPRRPQIVGVPAGTGDEVRAEMDGLVETCRHALPAAFADESYERRVADALAATNAARANALDDLQRQAQLLGFGINATPMGLLPVPLGREGRPMSPDVFGSLPPRDREPIEARGEQVQELIAATARALRRLDGEARERLRQVDREVTRLVVGPVLEELHQRFGALGLAAHVDAIEADVVKNIAIFKRFADPNADAVPQPFAQQLADEGQRVLDRYRVNLFVRHAEAPAGAPVVAERSPTFVGLFGRVEFENRFGALVTDFTRLRPGAIHVANGGFLILQAPDLLSDPRSWPRLKQALKTGEARLDDSSEQFGMPLVGLAPAPMPLAVKVILVGPPALFALMDALDPDFRALVKIRAEFEPDVEASPENAGTYAAFIEQTVQRSGLLPFDPAAIVELIRHGSRLAGRQDRLSTRLGLIGDLCNEASHIARNAGAATVDAGHIGSAEAARLRRGGLVPDRIRQAISEGTLHVETSGRVVGQVNGLAVFITGEAAFGMPMRITCRTGAGQRGVVAIERETERSGSIHTKGVLVLNGFLIGTFGREAPLAFNASMTFEQSYDEVEGDSASSAELYAILTSLADVHVRQDIAVTGAVDQFGNIQAVGGVTEKVEGFFDVCRQGGLTGFQGVILPKTNIRNLTLRADLVEAVEQGIFHLWAVERIEEGVEILTGMPARGNAPERGVFDRVEETLNRLRLVAAEASGRPGHAAPDGAVDRVS